LRCALGIAESRGARTQLFDGPFLASLPIYNPEATERTEQEAMLVETVRRADAIVIATPGYHGGIAGFVKNAIDLLEDTAKDDRVYFDRLPVGMIVAAYGWQATGSTLGSLRSIIHAMRGWPTPLGVTINSRETRFDDCGACSDPRVPAQLAAMVDQILWFTTGRTAA
jgi:FMN reductase